MPSNSLHYDLTIVYKFIHGDSDFADGWYVDTTEQIMPLGYPPVITRYGPMPREAMDACANSLIADSEKRIHIVKRTLAN